MNKYTDEFLLSYIEKSKFLKDTTKKLYYKKIEVIKDKIWTDKDKNLNNILNNPQKFIEDLTAFALKNPGRLKKIESYNTLGNHTKDTYISALMALFIHNQDLKNEQYDLYQKWKEEHEKIKKPIDNKYKSNEPTDRQKTAYITFEEVVKIRDALKDGSLEKLLVSMYTEIPPVRSDYLATAIYTRKPKETAVEENYIINRKKKPILVLQKYKTSSKYKTITIPIPLSLKKQIDLSLQENPRKYLFVSTRNKKPYSEFKNPEKSFNAWANYVLKQVFKNDNFHLTMLRHLYILRKDLKLEEKSLLEREKLANIMGHSVLQQEKYSWFIYRNKLENKN
jgi:integrase